MATLGKVHLAGAAARVPFDHVPQHNINESLIVGSVDNELQQYVWAKFKERCAALGVDYLGMTLYSLMELEETTFIAIADRQCLRMLAALHVADGRVHTVQVPLDDYLVPCECGRSLVLERKQEAVAS